MIDINELTEFLTKNKLTPNQYYFLLCLANGRKEKLLEYVSKVKKFSYKEELIPLEQQDFIFLAYKDTPDGKIVNFEKIIPKSKTMELFKRISIYDISDEYPTKIYVNGVGYAAIDVDPLTLETFYLRAIKNNQEIHEKVIEKVKKKKEEGNIKCKFSKFVYSKLWESEDADNNNVAFI